jgi:hypothetical protein
MGTLLFCHIDCKCNFFMDDLYMEFLFGVILSLFLVFRQFINAMINKTPLCKKNICYIRPR